MPPDSNAVFSLDHKILKELGVSEVWQAYIYNILTLFFLTLRRAAEDCSPNRNIHSLAVPLGAEGRGGDNPRNTTARRITKDRPTLQNRALIRWPIDSRREASVSALAKSLAAWLSCGKIEIRGFPVCLGLPLGSGYHFFFIPHWTPQGPPRDHGEHPGEELLGTQAPPPPPLRTTQGTTWGATQGIPGDQLNG